MYAARATTRCCNCASRPRSSFQRSVSTRSGDLTLIFYSLVTTHQRRDARVTGRGDWAAAEGLPPLTLEDERERGERARRIALRTPEGTQLRRPRRRWQSQHRNRAGRRGRRRVTARQLRRAARRRPLRPRVPHRLPITPATLPEADRRFVIVLQSSSRTRSSSCRRRFRAACRTTRSSPASVSSTASSGTRSSWVISPTARRLKPCCASCPRSRRQRSQPPPAQCLLERTRPRLPPRLRTCPRRPAPAPAPSPHPHRHPPTRHRARRTRHPAPAHPHRHPHPRRSRPPSPCRFPHPCNQHQCQRLPHRRAPSRRCSVPRKSRLDPTRCLQRHRQAWPNRTTLPRSIR